MSTLTQVRTWEVESIVNLLNAPADESTTITPGVLDALSVAAPAPAPSRPSQDPTSTIPSGWKPDLFTCMHLIWEDGTLGGKLAPAGKRCNELLQGTEFFGPLFKGKELAPVGGRHTAQMQLVGAVVRMLTSATWGTPDIAFGLLYMASAALGEDDDGTLFVDKLPQQITDCWKKDVERITQEVASKLAEPLHDEQKSIVLENIRQWYLKARAAASLSEAIEMLRKDKLSVLKDLQKGGSPDVRVGA